MSSMRTAGSCVSQIQSFDISNSSRHQKNEGMEKTAQNHARRGDNKERHPRRATLFFVLLSSVVFICVHPCNQRPMIFRAVDRTYPNPKREFTRMSDLVQLTKDNDIAIITINNPPVNALSPGVPEGIADSIAKINEDSGVKAAVLIGGGRTFVAGADIKEFGKMTSGKTERGTSAFLPLLTRIEDCRVPVVMAIHGTAFGGGLELAMAGHYRVASPDAQVGQPEVKLGIIPGAAGTQRLPRLAGVAKAVEMCADGNPVKAKDALAICIVDRIIEGDLLQGSLAFAREVAGKPAPQTRERNEKLGTPEQNAPIFAAARENTKKKQRGLMAPLAAIDAVEAATKMSFDAGSQEEQKLFLKCLFSDQSKAMIHVFDWSENR